MVEMVRANTLARACFMMTIYEEFGHFEGLKVAIAGMTWTTHALPNPICRLKRLGYELFFAGPEENREVKIADTMDSL